MKKARNAAEGRALAPASTRAAQSQKSIDAFPRRTAHPPAGPYYDVQGIEKGILALLSFLGHSYKKGVISDSLYERERTAALKNLDFVRQLDEPEEDAQPTEQSRRQKLIKNKTNIEGLLSFLEDAYNEGTISEGSYRELKRENLKKLSRINGLLGAAAEGAELGGGEKAPEDGIFPQEGQSETGVFDEDDALQTGSKTGYEGKLPENENEFLESPLPEIDAEPTVKPISFKEKLESLASGESPEDAYPGIPRDEAGEILESLKINPKKGGKAFGARWESGEPGVELEETEAGEILETLNINPKEKRRAAELHEGSGSYAENNPSFSASPQAQVKQEVEKKAGAILGKLGAIIGKGRKEQEGKQETAAASGQQGFQLPDKLPEEMTPEELAAAQKAQQEAQDEQAKAEAATTTAYAPDEGGGGGGADYSKLLLELEKLKVKLESTEGTRTVFEERIEHIMENIGELRTMLFEKESSSKEQEAKLDKFVEMVSDLEPQRFAKELDKRDRQLAEAAMKIEKLEAISTDMAQNVGRIRTTLEAIGSLKNISSVSKDIADRSAKIDSTVSKVERLADETGRVYVELNRKLNEFTLYRGKQDIMAESLKELVSMVESLSGKLDTYATKDDLRDFKRDMEDTKLSVNELQTKIILASEGDDLPSHIKDLQEEKEGLEQILESNEEEFIEGQIKEAEYKQIKELHTKKLQVVRSKLKEELSKIRQERAEESRKAQKVVSGFSEGNPAGAEGSSGADGKAAGLESDEGGGGEEEADDETAKAGKEGSKPDAGQVPPLAIKPQQAKTQKKPSQGSADERGGGSKKLKGKADAAAPSAQSRKIAATSIPSQQTVKAPPSKGAAPSPTDGGEDEIEGELDDQKLQEAEEKAQLEDAEQEEEELADEAESEGEGSDEKNPAEPDDANLGEIPAARKAPRAQSRPSKRLISAEPALSLKTEKALPTAGVSWVIKRASEGKRVAFDAKATTIKKDGARALLKLEDESGVIYGTYASPLRGDVSIEGTIAKDPQGVPYVKITKAKGRLDGGRKP